MYLFYRKYTLQKMVQKNALEENYIQNILINLEVSKVKDLQYLHHCRK